MEASCLRSHKPNSASGFTLLEMTIVIVIIAFVLAMAASSGIAVLSSARQSATIKKMAAIDDALLAYRRANDRLPCPGDLAATQTSTATFNSNYYFNYGVEAGGIGIANTAKAQQDGKCDGKYITLGSSSSTFSSPTAGVPALPAPASAPSTDSSFSTAVATTSATSPGVYEAEGSVPTVTLGLPNDYMYDGWGNHIRYAVDATLTTPGAFKYFPSGAKCGPITINGNNASSTSNNYFPKTTTAIYALISHGPNGHGGYTTNGVAYNASSSSVDELTNCRCTSAGAFNSSYTPTLTFVQKDPQFDYNHQDGAATSQAYFFDDIVTYKERPQLPAPSDKPGSICPKIYVADTGNSRISVFDINGNYLTKFGQCTNDTTSFSFPTGVDVDSQGNIVIADSGLSSSAGNRVVKCDALGNFILGIGCNYQGVTANCSSGSVGAYQSLGSAAYGGFYNPWGVAVDASDNIWVVDRRYTVDDTHIRLEEFSSVGTFIQSFGSGGSSNGVSSNLYQSTNITIDKPNGYLWVADDTNNRLLQYQIVANGTGISGVGTAAFLQSIGGPSPYTCELTPAGSVPACASGNGNGQFNGAVGVAVDRAANIWGLDYSNNRVQKLNQFGTFQNAFSAVTGASPATLNTPRGLTIDSLGNIWVVDDSNARIVKFDNQMNYLSQLGTGTSGSGNTQFANPANIAFSPSSIIGTAIGR